MWETKYRIDTHSNGDWVVIFTETDEIVAEGKSLTEALTNFLSK